MSQCAVLRRLGVPWAAVLLVAGCGVPDDSRWERGDASLADAAAVVSGGDSMLFAVVEVGPVEAAVEVRGEVRVIDPITVFAEGPGRLERRTTAVGDQVVANDVVLEFAPAPDPADELRLEILQIEREIALLEERSADIERLDAEIEAAQGETSVGPAFSVVAPVDGTVAEYFVSVFDVVAAGDPIFALGDAARRHVVAALPDAATIAVGDEVGLVSPRSVLAESTPGVVSAIIGQDHSEDRDRAESSTFVVELDVAAPFGVGDDVLVVFESTTESSALRLSTDAVRGAGAAEYVIAVDVDGGWTRVAIDAGARTDRFVQLLATEPSLEAGDRVVLP